MRTQTSIASSKRSRSEALALRPLALPNVPIDVLVSIAVLGLIGALADGHADASELRAFTKSFRRKFWIPESKALRIAMIATRRIVSLPSSEVVSQACDELNFYLSLAQRVDVFDAIADVLVADGKVHEGEEFYLDFIAEKLGIDLDTYFAHARI